MRRKLIGYIAQDDGSPLVIHDGILYLGNGATLFPTRRAAQAAMDRTDKYAEREHLPWFPRKYRISRVWAYPARKPVAP